MRFQALAVGFALLVAGLSSCSTYQDHLNRGQRYYDENEYEQALAIWRVIESDMDSLSDNDQARYAYLRGMTDYRLGFRSYARHWLALGLSIEKQHAGGLRPEWIARANDALADLNDEVFGIGPFQKPTAAATIAPPVNASSGADASTGDTGPADSKPCRIDDDCPASEACLMKRCVSP